jgi:hypothetical protein
MVDCLYFGKRQLPVYLQNPKWIIPFWALKPVKKLLFAIIFLLVSTASVNAEEARLEDVKVVHSPGLRVSFVVKGAFKEGILEAIKSGIPTSFTFIIRLHRSKRLWFDELIGTWKFKHTVKYDALKEEYEVSLDENKGALKTKDLKKMKTLMVTGDEIEIKPSPNLTEGEVYKLGLKAELDTIKLPFFLDYILFFVKLWDFETDWYSHSFSLERAPMPSELDSK